MPNIRLSAVFAFTLLSYFSPGSQKGHWLQLSQIEAQEIAPDFTAFETVRKASLNFNMTFLHKGPAHIDTLQAGAELNIAALAYRESKSALQSPSWAKFRVDLPASEENAELLLEESWPYFTAKIMGQIPVQKEDMGLVFPWSTQNEIQVLADKEAFWPALLADLESARHHIHIQMFGFQNQEITRKITDLLRLKVAEGVKVVMLLDQWGARAHMLEKNQSDAYVDELRAAGLVVYLTKDSSTGGLGHMDHRKIYIVDGRIGITTGYTIEDHMRNEHFDVGIRTTGEIVGQMQMSFLMSQLYFGKVPLNISREELTESYFPQPSNAGTQSGRVVINIPGVVHTATQGYYSMMGGFNGSMAPLYIINPYLNDGVTMSLLLNAAKTGREVHVFAGAVGETRIYNYSMRRDFDILTAAGVRCYLYYGPDLKKRSHAKGILVEGESASFGSTNLDAFSLFQNYEQNVESRDTQFVDDIKTDVFDYIRAYSKPHVATKGFKAKLKLKIQALPGSIIRFILGNKNGQGYKPPKTNKPEQKK